MDQPQPRSDGPRTGRRYPEADRAVQRPVSADDTLQMVFGAGIRVRAFQVRDPEREYDVLGVAWV